MQPVVPVRPWLLTLAEVADNLSRPSREQYEHRPLFRWRASRVRALVERGPYRKPVEPEPLPSFTPEDVAERGVEALTGGFRNPVVVRGFYRDLAAVRRWSADYLVDALGETVVPVLDMRAEEAYAYSNEMMALPFREAVRRMASERLYVNNVTRVFIDNEILAGDLELDRIGSILGIDDPDDQLIATAIFIGGEKVGSRLHCAPAGNAFANIRGRKRWTLFHPALGPYLLPLWSRKLPIAFSATHYDVGEPAHELVRHLPRYEVVLEPGDMLYNGPWWWHDVRNLDPFTVGCAIRHRGGTFLLHDPTLRNAPLYTALSIYPWANVLRLAWNVRHRLTGKGTTWRDVLNRFLDQKIFEDIDGVAPDTPVHEGNRTDAFPARPGVG